MSSNPLPSEDNLRIGIPSKGRLSERATDLLKQGGFRFRRQDRTLFARVRDMPYEVVFLRTDDIPVLCAEGAIDMGITGSDLVEESQADVTIRLKLGVGQCRLAICIPSEGRVRTIQDLGGSRVATSFPRSTSSYLAKHAVNPHLVNLSGSVEIMIALGVADAIVDLVETGSTLAANRLKLLDVIGSHETVLIQGPGCRHIERADRMVRRLEGVIIARSYSLMEYNIPQSQLKAAEQITPGYRSPTINRLEDPNWCSVRVMVRHGDIADAMDRLEALGASAILETKIGNCRL